MQKCENKIPRTILAIESVSSKETTPVLLGEVVFSPSHGKAPQGPTHGGCGAAQAALGPAPPVRKRCSLACLKPRQRAGVQRACAVGLGHVRPHSRLSWWVGSQFPLGPRWLSGPLAAVEGERWE